MKNFFSYVTGKPSGRPDHLDVWLPLSGLVTVLAAGALMLCGCDRDGVISPDVFEDYSSLSDVGHDMMVLGDKLEDPYTVENMRRSFSALYPTRSGRDAVVTSDLYVRFLPEGDYGYKVLERLGIDLLDHPVDYEILKYGDYYHDPSLPSDRITWQYAIVPSDFEFPSDVPYEILDECFIPENVSTRAADVDWAAVERESFRLTGNAALLPAPSTRGAVAAPEGRITIMDDRRHEEVGVSGVKVVVNTFVKISKTYTDAEGRYHIDKSFASNLHYRLVFQNKKGFRIGVNLLLLPASVSTLGKGGPEGKSVRITSSSERKLFCRAVVNNAADDYYRMCNTEGSGITAPPSNLRIWIFQKISAGSCPMLQQGVSVMNLLKEWLGEYGTLINVFFPDITLGVSGLTDYASIYTLAWHELSHASHYMQAGYIFWSDYIQFILRSFITSGGKTYGVGTEEKAGYCEVGEMWAYFMETLLLWEKYGVSGYVAGSMYWFFPQVFLYLNDRGLTAGDIFSALTVDVTSREELRQRLLSLYPSYRTAIRQAFERYTKSSLEEGI